MKVFLAAARCKVNDIQVFLAPANPALVSSSSKHLQSASIYDTYTGLKQFRCVADVLATEVVAPSEGTSPLERANDGGDRIVRPISHANKTKKQSTTSSKAPGIDSADQEGVPEYIDSADQEGDDHLHSPISEPSPNTTKKINPLANRYGEAAEGLSEAERLSNWHIEQSRSYRDITSDQYQHGDPGKRQSILTENYQPHSTWMEKNLNWANFCAELSNLSIFSLPEQKQKLDKMFRVLLTQSTNNDIRSTSLEVAEQLASSALKDMSWKKALDSPQRDQVLDALHNGINSLCKTILTNVETDVDYTMAKEQAISGQFLMDIKRKFKARRSIDGWLCNTARPDLSRIAQRSASSTVSALSAAKRLFRYPSGIKDYSLQTPLHVPTASTHAPQPWGFFCDSDFPGNAEEQNKRQSQNGMIAIVSGAPVYWASKGSSVCFAHPDIGEAHADISSGAAEVYAAGNACFDFIHLSYVIGEMGMTFPKPIHLQMDNAACQTFCEGTVFNKSRLKYIDARQEWVRVLRNKSILQAFYVPSADNLTHIFTKILGPKIFQRIRGRIMHRRIRLV